MSLNHNIQAKINQSLKWNEILNYYVSSNNAMPSYICQELYQKVHKKIKELDRKIKKLKKPGIYCEHRCKCGKVTDAYCPDSVHDDLCDDGIDYCNECKNSFCKDCLYFCKKCEKETYCKDCKSLFRCDRCNSIFCYDFLKGCGGCDNMYCNDCFEIRKEDMCKECGTPFCHNCLELCYICEKGYCEDCVELIYYPNCIKMVCNRCIQGVTDNILLNTLQKN